LMQKWLWKAVECDTILHYAFPMHQKWKVLPVPTNTDLEVGLLGMELEVR
jgi:hypothetical protein